jgi:hypothetical protein
MSVMILTPWQRTNILAALNYLKDQARAGKDQRAEALSQGLHEVLEPARRTLRMQREAAQAATAAGASGRERRTGRDRRFVSDRRQKDILVGGTDRRGGKDRRGADRRGTS